MLSSLLLQLESLTSLVVVVVVVVGGGGGGVGDQGVVIVDVGCCPHLPTSWTCPSPRNQMCASCDACRPVSGRPIRAPYSDPLPTAILKHVSAINTSVMSPPAVSLFGTHFTRVKLLVTRWRLHPPPSLCLSCGLPAGDCIASRWDTGGDVHHRSMAKLRPCLSYNGWRGFAAFGRFMAAAPPLYRDNEQ